MKRTLMKKFFVTATILIALTGTAYANQCPSLIKKVEEMAKSMPGDEATMVKVNEQIALAKKEHEAGSHNASVAASNDAWKLLGM